MVYYNAWKCYNTSVPRGCRIAVIIPVFQTGDRSSTLRTRTRYNLFNTPGVYWCFCYNDDMLRDFEFDHANNLLPDILGRAGIDLGHKEHPIDLLRFEVITPDSFMWRVLVRDTIYYIYAEDYIPHIDHVKDVFDGYLKDKNWEFVTPLPDPTNTMEHAMVSGYDIIFVVKSSEDSNEAHFSGNAPRGFTH